MALGFGIGIGITFVQYPLLGGINAVVDNAGNTVVDNAGNSIVV